MRRVFEWDKLPTNSKEGTVTEPLKKTTARPDPEQIRELEKALNERIRGKEDVIRLALIGILARGHILLEDVPGVGKTTLARGLAQGIGGNFKRIQFTSDMLPTDILGVSVLAKDQSGFVFHPGPIFANVVLADEINRTNPRTQSALLEAMNEGRVTVEQETRILPDPFLVFATQNPLEHQGTYPLPESQLDRFLLRLSIGYPSEDLEMSILRDFSHSDAMATMPTVLTPEELKEHQNAVASVQFKDEVLKDLLSIARRTREHPDMQRGVSTRAAMELFRGAQARAYLDGREFGTPDDARSLVIPSLAHRTRARGSALGSNRDQEEAILLEIMEQIPVG